MNYSLGETHKIMILRNTGIPCFIKLHFTALHRFSFYKLKARGNPKLSIYWHCFSNSILSLMFLSHILVILETFWTLPLLFDL